MHTYVAFYNKQKTVVEAKTANEARNIAATYFRAKKPWDVTVILAELGGIQLAHFR